MVVEGVQVEKRTQKLRYSGNKNIDKHRWKQCLTLDLLIGFLYLYAMQESLENLTKEQLLTLFQKKEDRLVKTEKDLA